MDANVAHAELARPFDERYSDVGAVKFEAATFRAPLRVALPCRDGVAIDRILHELERATSGPAFGTTMAWRKSR